MPTASHTNPVKFARISVSTIFFINGMGFASWVPHIPAVQRRFQLSESALGLSLLSIAVGAILSMPLTGLLISRYGSRSILRIIGFMYCLVIPAMVAAPSVPLLVLALFLFGAVNGAMDVSMNAHGVLVEKRIGKNIMSSFHGLFSLGGLAGASLAGIMLSVGVSAVHHVLMTMGTLLIPLLIVLPGLLPPQGEITVKDTTEKGGLFMLRGGPLLSLGLFAFFVLMAEGAMADWTAIYIGEMPEGSGALGAAGFAGFSLTMAVGRLTGDYIIRIAGKTKVVGIGVLISAAGLVLAAMTQTPVMAITGFALVGAGLSNVVPVLFGAAGNVPGIEPGKGIATVTTSGYTGFLIGPPLIGFTAEHITLGGSLLMLGICFVLIAFFVGRVMRTIVADKMHV